MTATATNCDVSSFGGAFQSPRSKKRVELDDFDALGSLKVGQRVRATNKQKGVKLGKVKRFSEAAGRLFADVEFSITRLKFLKMINLDDLEPAPSRDDIALTCRRSKAKNGLVTGM